MATDIVKINVQVDSDLKATGVWASDGPIYLVELESDTGDVLKSRFDTQKAAFIDPVPGAEHEGAQELAKSLAAISKPGK